MWFKVTDKDNIEAAKVNLTAPPGGYKLLHIYPAHEDWEIFNDKSEL